MDDTAIDNIAEAVERRRFPRMVVRCAVLYRLGDAPEALIGMSVDFSATGLNMVCKHAVEPGNTIQIELKPGRDKRIPALRADGKVVRCTALKGGLYAVSCRLLHVQSGNPNA